MKCLTVFFLLILSALVQAQDLSKEFAKVAEPLKGKISARYIELLRVAPGAKGKVAFEIYISKNGNLKSCTVKHSDFNKPNFEQSICDLYKSINYSSMSVKQVKFVYENQFFSM
ncbi:MAG: hypothetical protein RL497_2110 [Pseudomonadota bacterium]|jgi:hypothetical protein